MGGYGSGRRLDAKETTAEYRDLDVRFLVRKGMLRSGSSGVLTWSRNGRAVGSIQTSADETSVTLVYRHRRGNAEWKEERYPVRITRTLCHLGGSRPWFICPVAGCGRRVAILYGGAIFACRRCYRLAYPSTREDVLDRAMRRADRLRDRLGWNPGIGNANGRKPKWMRWRTFHRLSGRHNDFAAQFWLGVARRFGLGKPDLSE
jgi:hypothetical protein